MFFFNKSSWVQWVDAKSSSTSCTVFVWCHQRMIANISQSNRFVFLLFCLVFFFSSSVRHNMKHCHQFDEVGPVRWLFCLCFWVQGAMAMSSISCTSLTFHPSIHETILWPWKLNHRSIFNAFACWKLCPLQYLPYLRQKQQQAACYAMQHILTTHFFPPNTYIIPTTTNHSPDSLFFLFFSIFLSFGISKLTK